MVEAFSASMYLVQILLPLCGNDGQPFAPGMMAAIKAELMDKFGGFTAYGRAPAEGVWAHDGQRTRDDLIIIEVMIPALDQPWWAAFRLRLEHALSQQKIIIRAHALIAL